MEEELDVEDITFFRSWAEGQMKVEVGLFSCYARGRSFRKETAYNT
jgi:hypothetical protein